MSLSKSNTLETINFSPLNTSKSKAMFSFNKSSRFIEHKEIRYYFDLFSSSSLYAKPSCLSKRATSFGYGLKSELINKYIFAQNQRFINNPSPDKYQKHSDFQLSPKKGITIGVGRQNCKNVSIFYPAKNPAPTDYNCKQNKQNAAAYSMRSKLKLPELFPDKKTPGPGQCKLKLILDKTQELEKDGFSMISKYKSSKSFKIHTRSSSSIDKTKPPALGPLTYNTVLPSTGKQILSKKKTEKSFFFDKKPRITMKVDSKSPGPGAYGVFSEFNR